MKDKLNPESILTGELLTLWHGAVDRLEAHPESGRLPEWFRENLRSATPSGWDESTLVVRIGSQITREWLDRKCRTILEEILSEETGSAALLRVEAGPAPAPGRRKSPSSAESGDGAKGVSGSSGSSGTVNAGASPARRAPSPDAIRARLTETLNCVPLNSRYRFDTYVEGESNRFAAAAAAAVARAPGESYNPLFIHGGVGLGKTHLMHAIGQEILETRPDTVIAYLSGEAFTSSFVSAIRERKMEEFRRLYKQVDVWLVDDIQFLAAKEATGEEFFHTFNALHDTNRQVVVCSDRPPQELRILDDRMASRFQAGLVADIGSPAYETRLAILEKKAGLEAAEIPGDVLQMMARMIQSNIRVLEGALIRLLAHASFTNSPINLSMATGLLSRYFDEGHRAPVRVEKVQKVVCDSLEVPLEALLGKKRDRQSLLARQMAMYLSRELTDSSLQQIGQLFGNKDHSTVAHACQTFKQTLNTDAEIERQTARICDRIRRSK